MGFPEFWIVAGPNGAGKTTCVHDQDNPTVEPPTIKLETDPRFPSGRWIGFFLDRRLPGKHQMELLLTFHQGSLSGEGRDRVGDFVVHGRYSTQDGTCHWHKRYVGKHDVYYQGYAEEKGIWGTWQLVPEQIYGLVKGGFHVWPEGLGDPTEPALSEAAPAPVEMAEVVAG